MTAKTKQVKFTTKYIYTGMWLDYRPLATAKCYHRFLDEKGEESLFSRKPIGVHIGGTYLGGKDSMPRRPEWVHGDDEIKSTETKRDRWRADDEAARIWKQEVREKHIGRKAAESSKDSKRLKFLVEEIAHFTAEMDVFSRGYFVRALGQRAWDLIGERKRKTKGKKRG